MSAGAVALPVLGGGCAPAGAAQVKEGTHHVPADKNLSKEWVESLFAKGEAKVYRGDERACIGMPVGGICAGQLYLRGDGTLAEWAVFNHEHNTGFGDTSYRTYVPTSPLEQGFAIKLFDGKLNPSYALDGVNFPEVAFVGEYPIARVQFGAARYGALPVEVSLEAFSPFIPLDTKDSGI
ncbi:MAG TPA: GH116 family glycosyl-hydrolase, partial [Isosphaeraceae bacterium]|nr:GH116 family glycosyl-hydrolase [Isosphaeraceae bacterium]